MIEAVQRCRRTGPGLEVLCKGRVSFDVEEDGSLGEEVRGSAWLCVQICSESLGEDMDGCENQVTIGFANIAVLHEEILGILRKVRGREDAESWSAVVLEWGRLKLWVSEPGKIAAVELYVFRCD